MLIAADAGNSHIRLGGYEGDEQIFAASIATEPRQTADFYACTLRQVLSLHGVNSGQAVGAVIGSVVPRVTGVLEQALRLLGVQNVLVVSSGVKTGLNIRSEQPQQVGADRVAAAVAAKALGKLPCVVVDCGTATTFTVLDERGALAASAITAGVCLSLEALREKAAQLPTVALHAGEQHELLARNTADAMRAGAVIGAAAMIDGMIARYAQALDKQPYVWLTGGSAGIIARHLSIDWQGAETLCLDGLRLIWQKNRSER